MVWQWWHSNLQNTIAAAWKVQLFIYMITDKIKKCQLHKKKCILDAGNFVNHYRGLDFMSWDLCFESHVRMTYKHTIAIINQYSYALLVNKEQATKWPFYWDQLSSIILANTGSTKIILSFQPHSINTDQNRESRMINKTIQQI